MARQVRIGGAGRFVRGQAAAGARWGSGTQGDGTHQTGFRDCRCRTNGRGYFGLGAGTAGPPHGLTGFPIQ